MNISKTIPGFHNGISQQAATMRLDTQVEAAENCLGTLVEGTIKRPNTDFIATLSSVADGDVFIHTIVRDASERFFLILTGDSSVPIEIFTAEGVPCTVQYGTLSDEFLFTADAAVKQYLTMTSGRAKNNYRAVTIADHTFIVNRTVETDMSATVSHGGGSLDGSVQSFAKLTDVSADEGEVWEVTGNDTNHFDGYYVEKQAGTLWLETIAPNIPYKLEASLMPHRLVRIAENSFVFAPIVWEERTIGDDASSPIPSFVGNRIKSIFFFRNRLGFLAGDNVILSAAGDYYRFFPKTALDVLDDDPIDTAASLKEVTELYSVAGFNKNLIIFGNPQQYSLGSGDNSMLTPATVALDGTTHFAIQVNSEPISMGSNVYFANPRQQHVSIREYILQESTLLDDAADITAHCPDYIPMGDITLQGISSMDMLFAHSSADPAALYVYKFYWVGNEKAQSAWHRWSFDDNVISMTVLDESLYILFDGNETKLERIDVESLDDGDLDFRCHLDHKVVVEGEWTGEVTRFELPYTPKMGSLITGGIDDNTTLMLQSDSPPYIGEPTGGLDEHTILLIRSNQGSDPFTFVDSSVAEREITHLAETTRFYHDTSQKKFGLSSVSVASEGAPNVCGLTFPVEGSEVAYDFDWNSDFTVDMWVYMDSYISTGIPSTTPTNSYDQRSIKMHLFAQGFQDYEASGMVGLQIGGAALWNRLQFVLSLSATDGSRTAFEEADGHTEISINSHDYLFAEDKLGAFPLKKWTHVAIQRWADYICIFRDGVKVNGFAWAYDISGMNEAFLCLRRQWSGSTYGVHVDEYRVSNTPRYYGNFSSIGAQCFVPEDYMYGISPVIYDRTAEDASKYVHPVTLTNSYHKNDDGWPVRFPRTSFYFDGESCVIDVPHHSVFDFTTLDFTIDFSVWFKSFNEATLFSKQTADDWGWLVKWDGTGFAFVWSGTGEDAAVQSVSWEFSLTLDVWYHIAIVRRGDVMTLYVNGRSKSDRVFPGTVKNSEAQLKIGEDHSGNYPFNGALEEIRFSDVARWTSNFLPPLAPYTDDVDGWYQGVNGGIPDGFDASTMDEGTGLQYLARYFGMEVVNPVTGLSYPEATIWGNEIYIPENVEGYSMIIGRNYDMGITLTPLYMTDQSGKAILDGRLQMRTMTFSFQDTGYFNFAVAPIGRSSLTHTFTGNHVGSSITGQVRLHSGERRFLVNTNVKGTTFRITNETYLPSKIQSAAYEATFTRRSRNA